MENINPNIQPQSTNSAKDEKVIPTNFGDVAISPPVLQKTENDIFTQAENNSNLAQDPRGIYAKVFALLGESNINPFLLFIIGFTLVVLTSIWGSNSFVIGYIGSISGVIIFLAGAVKIYITSKHRALVIVGILAFFIAVIILSSIIFK
jgi:hypothetical protein